MPPNSSKRGRPSNEIIPDLIREGKLREDSHYKCGDCHRVFPRSKSLQAHSKIHTNEKPYKCSYPDCAREFRQSGQLKNHVRRHTGEKPFACRQPGCLQRFIHSSRRCPRHSQFDLIKDGQEQIFIPENLSEAEDLWFKEYKENKGKPAKRKISSAQNVVKRMKSEVGTLPGTSDDSCSNSSIDCGLQEDNKYSAPNFGFHENGGRYHYWRDGMREKYSKPSCMFGSGLVHTRDQYCIYGLIREEIDTIGVLSIWHSLGV